MRMMHYGRMFVHTHTHTHTQQDSVMRDTGFSTKERGAQRYCDLPK